MHDSDFYSITPLDLEEVIQCIRSRWGVTYDLQLVVRRKKIFLQMMWGYLEQQSFPLDQESFALRMNQVIEVINRIGKADVVREWLMTVNDRPRLGKAITLPLVVDERLQEFVVEISQS